MVIYLYFMIPLDNCFPDLLYSQHILRFVHSIFFKTLYKGHFCHF